MCKDPYFNAQVCRLLLVINVIICLTNVFMYLTIPNASVSILHAIFNLLIAVWMLKAFNYYKGIMNRESRNSR
jgi:hypothetical protein